MKDFYKILNVSKNASEKEIRAAFRKLSMKYHPDRQAGKSDAEKKEAEEKFKEISEAYDTLSNKDKRYNYDNFGTTSGNGGFSSSFNMNDFMRNHSSFFEDIFGGGGGHFSFGGFRQQRSPQQPNYNLPEDGNDIQLNLKISFKEAVNGCEKTLKIHSSKQCDKCNGTGIDNDVKPSVCHICGGSGQIVKTVQNGFCMTQTVSICSNCNGSGYSVKKCSKCNGSKRLDDTKIINIKVPMGIDNGQRLRVVGSGQCGVKGGNNGNLYLNINIAKQNIFERHGLNVYSKINIDAVTAILGGKIKVATPYQIIDIDLPREIDSSKQIVLEKHGIRNGNNVGMLILTFDILPLTNLSNEQHKMLNSFKQTISNKNFDAQVKYLDEAEKVI